ncbi:MAG: SMP-30/gluconolactonase/LRE family protein [Deinococcus sp.]|nr:SMP-30/gluconolactonase/LRE family protein [Deinococcus sp.]
MERQIITTVAGGGIAPTREGLAAETNLSLPLGLAIDRDDNLYIADSLNSRVLKVNPAGHIVAVYGNGTPGFSGDGGAAAEAQLDLPYGVAVDRDGNVYIGDTLNHRVRQVDPAGVITTLLGGPESPVQLYQPTGLILDAAGALYIADSLNNRILKRDPDGVISVVAGVGEPGLSGGPVFEPEGRLPDRLGDGGLATDARFRFPEGLAVDLARQLIYIADSLNNRVRQISYPSGTITTIAGGQAPSAETGLAGPTGLVLDGAGRLYIADTEKHRVLRWDGTGTLTSVAGTGSPGYSGDGGPASQAQLLEPWGLAFDSRGNLFIADSRNNIIRKAELGAPAP